MKPVPAALVVYLACGVLAGAASAAPTMSRDEYKTLKERVEAEYQAARQACEGLAGNARDICIEQAKAHEKVGVAELDYRQDPNESNRARLAETRADARYNVAKEKCDDLAGNAKDVCVREAKADRARAIADARAEREAGNARADAARIKREAQYEAAVERCDDLAGNAKTECVAQAKARYGKR